MVKKRQRLEIDLKWVMAVLVVYNIYFPNSKLMTGHSPISFSIENYSNGPLLLAIGTPDDPFSNTYGSSPFDTLGDDFMDRNLFDSPYQGGTDGYSSGNLPEDPQDGYSSLSFHLVEESKCSLTKTQKETSEIRNSQQQQLFNCLNLTGQPKVQYQEESSKEEECRVKHLRRQPRDETTIAKVIFTIFKKLLLHSPVDLKQYFKTCPYSKNHRTLMDFQVPFLYAQWMDSKQPGAFVIFKQFLRDMRPQILEEGSQKYNSNPERLSTFISYVDRIYEAYSSGQDSAGRMRILYKKPAKLPNALLKLQQIRARWN